MPRSDLVVGVWDVEASPVSLGGLLVFVAELYGLVRMRKLQGCAIVFMGAHDAVPLAETILPYVDCVDEVVYQERRSKVSSPGQWPVDPLSHRYDSMLMLQTIYRKHGLVPVVPLSAELLQWADEWLHEHCKSRRPIIVHLKNRSNQVKESNANLDVWRDFFASHVDDDVVFVLIGNDAVADSIKTLDNTIVTNDRGLALSQELALIRQGLAFMGMASGPCNMAVCSRVPYAVFKNPNHHREAMIRELGHSDHFAFATAGQVVLRTEETRGVLEEQYLALVKYAREGVSG